MPSPVDALISGLLAHPVTSAQLRQDAPHTAGLSTTDAERVRAHLLASFERTGIPDDALPIVAEELRTERESRRARGCRPSRARARPGAGGEWARLLREAADRVSTSDVYVRWQPEVVAPNWMRTARGELLATLQDVAAP